VFVGQVVCCAPTSPPPNIGVRLDCFSRQVDKSKFVTEPCPNQSTFYDYVKWAAKQMGFGDNFVCETSFNDTKIKNPSASTFIAESLLVDIQDNWKPAVAAFIDNNRLIVKDINKIIDPNHVAQVSEFIGIPQWTEWGVDFSCMFTPSIQLAGAVNLTSKLNPSIDNKYVVMGLEYDLASREAPFYVKAFVSPPAS
jgi:hypothetical protein